MTINVSILGYSLDRKSLIETLLKKRGGKKKRQGLGNTNASQSTLPTSPLKNITTYSKKMQNPLSLPLLVNIQYCKLEKPTHTSANRQLDLHPLTAPFANTNEVSFV